MALSLILGLSSRFIGDPGTSSFGGDFAEQASQYQLSFALTGPVLNDIPDGYTVTGPNVVDNHWTDPFAPPVDTTPPVVSGVADRPANALGWYDGPVRVDWRAVDGSGVASDPPDSVVSAEGRDLVVTSAPSCDASGNCASGSVTLSIDLTPPVAACSDPDRVFTVVRSGVALLDADVSDGLSGAGGPRSASVLVPVDVVGRFSVVIAGSDFAGNVASVTCSYSVVPVAGDTTPPTLTVPGGVVVDATSPNGARVSYSVTAQDDLDRTPAVRCAPRSGRRFAIGTTTVTCTARDASGNTATASFTVAVRGAAAQLDALDARTRSFVDLLGLRIILTLVLRTAEVAIAIDRPALACTLLSAYASVVRLAPARALTPIERLQLLRDVSRITAVVGCL